MSENIEDFLSNFEKAVKNHYAMEEQYSNRRLIKISTIHEVQYTTKILDFTVDDSISNLSKEIASEKEGIATETETFQNEILKKHFDFETDSNIDISIDWIKQVEDGSAVYGSMKLTNKNEIKNKRVFLFVYITSNNKWKILQEGEFTNNTTLIMNKGIIITCSHGNDEIIIYAKNEENRYIEVNRRKFTGYYGTKRHIVLIDSYITRVTYTKQHTQNLFNIETIKYNKALNTFEVYNQFNMKVNCACEWPTNSPIINLLISEKVDMEKSKNMFRAILNNMFSGKHFGQSDMQFITLTYSERNKMCLFWLHNPKENEPLVFICYRGHMGRSSYDGKLITIQDDWEPKYYIWLTENLIENKMKIEEKYDFYEGPLYQLPKAMEIDTGKRKVIMCELISTSSFNNKFRIITLFNDNCFMVWEENPVKRASLSFLYKIKTPVLDLHAFTFDGKSLVMTGKNNNNNTFIWNYNTFEGTCTHKIALSEQSDIQRIFIGNKRGFLFYLAGKDLKRIEYSFRPSIYRVFQNGETSISFVGLSPTGKWLVYKIWEGKGSLAIDFYTLFNFDNKDKVIINHRNIIQFCVSVDEDFVACATIDRKLIFQNMSAHHETIFDMTIINEGKIEVDFSGDFTPGYNCSRKRMWMSEDEILTTAGIDRKEGIIYVIWFSYNRELFQYKEIGRIEKLNEKRRGLSMSSRGSLNARIFDKDIEKIEYRWLHCIWEFSPSGQNLIFHFMDEENSKSVIWDCYGFDYKVEIFPFTLLKKKIPVFKRQSSFLQSIKPSSELISETKEKEYKVPDIYFVENGKILIIKNYQKNTFFAANSKTDQKDINTLLAQEKNDKIKMIEVNKNGDIFYSQNDGESDVRIIRRAEIEKIPKKLEDKAKSEIYMRFPLPKGHKKNKPGFEERITCSPDANIMAHIVSDSRGESSSGARAVLWNPDNRVTSSLLQYNIIKYLKDEKPLAEDVSPLFEAHLINRINRYGKNLLFDAVEDRNVELVKDIINWAKENNCHLNFIAYPPNRTKSEFKPENNVLKIAMDNEDVQNVKNLVNAITDGIVSIEESVLITKTCKMDLILNYRERFIELVTCLLDQKETINIERSAFNKHNYITITEDTLSCPQWKGNKIEYWEDRLWTEEEENLVYNEFKEKITQNSEKINKYDILGLSSISYLIDHHRNLTKYDIWLYERFLYQAHSEVQEIYMEEERVVMGDDMEQEDRYLETIDEIQKCQHKLNKIKIFNSYSPIKDTNSHSTPYHKKQEENNASDLQKSKELEVISSIFPWQNAAKMGREGLLHTLQEHNLQWDTFNALPIKQLIDYKWNKYAQAEVLRSLILHIIIAVFFILYAIIYGYERNVKCCFYMSMELLLLSVASFVSLWILISEFVQFRQIIINEKDYWKNLSYVKESVYKWLHNKWNLCEALIFSFIAFVIPALHLISIFYEKDDDINEDNPIAKLHNSFTSVTCCLMCWKLLYFFLPYRISGPLVIMIFEIIRNIMFFLLIVIMLLIGFGTAFFILFKDDKNTDITEAFSTYAVSLISTFGMMLGEFDQNWFIESNSKFLAIVLFIIYMLIMLVVFFNLIIAIMGDSYDNIKGKEEISFYIARAEIIRDVETKMIEKFKQKKNKEIKQFLHILRNKEQEEDVSGWQGKIEQITNNIKKAMQKLFIKEISKLRKDENQRSEMIKKSSEAKMELLSKKTAIIDEKIDAIMQNLHHDNKQD